MRQAVLVIGKWEQPLFERHLTKAGYSFTQGEGLTSDTTVLTINTTDLEALREVLKAITLEAASRLH